MTDQEPSADRAYREIKARLLDGRHPGGSLLSEGAYATELGMSRTPVREAFLRLQAEEFLSLYPKRGALVVPITPGEARHVLQARLLLESFALDTIVARGPDALARLGGSLATEAVDTPSAQDALFIGRTFHTRLMTAAGNPVLASVHEKLWDQQIRIAAASMAGPGHPHDDVLEHAEIAAAIQAGHAPLAHELLHAHATAVLRRLGHDRGPDLLPPDGRRAGTDS
ncbi:GntR family transcriptional regulator [Streptomyces sp. NPDC051546]|uniref:GntR family transcriptional regulator n=1 Tax=Streptomyces sp. NPDC051546 TaxID=3365655 RepID=UPI0037B4103F